MRIELQLFATLRSYLPAGRTPASLDVPDGSTVGDVRAVLGIPPDLAHVTLVNGDHVPAERRLREGDVLTFCPPLVGGSGAAVDGSARDRMVHSGGLGSV